MSKFIYTVYLKKIYNRQYFKLVLCWYFHQSRFVVFVRKPQEMSETRIKAANSLNIPIGNDELSYELYRVYILTS